MIAAVPFAGGWGLTWRDVVIALVASMLTGHGISIGFHRYFTHGSLRPRGRCGLSWQGAATAFFWGSLVRVGLLHHVTWSINSMYHTIGDRPFLSRDKSGNMWWLAVLSFGESWHNLHHADPTSARHGVLPGQVDTSARIISWFKKLGVGPRRPLADP